MCTFLLLALNLNRIRVFTINWGKIVNLGIEVSLYKLGHVNNNSVPVRNFFIADYFKLISHANHIRFQNNLVIWLTSSFKRWVIQLFFPFKVEWECLWVDVDACRILKTVFSSTWSVSAGNYVNKIERDFAISIVEFFIVCYYLVQLMHSNWINLRSCHFILWSRLKFHFRLLISIIIIELWGILIITKITNINS